MMLRFFNVFLILLFACSPRRAPVANPTPLTSLSLDSAITAAEKRLVSMSQPDGSFIYREDLNSSRRIKPKYNSLRHSGSIYSLTMFESVFPSAETRSVIERASHYLVDHFLIKIGSGKNTKLAFTTSNRHSEKDIAHLGGAGLGLVALLSTEKLHPGFTSPEILEGVGQFLVFMQKADGGFYSRYRVDGAVRDDSDPSLYYPGEATLGLVMLYEQDKNPKWLEAAERGLLYLSQHRHSVSDTPPDNWALIASAEIWPYQKKFKTLKDDAFFRHIALISQSDMQGQVTDPRNDTYGCYGNEARTTPTATRLEGLLSILPILTSPTTAELKSTIEKSAKLGIEFLMRFQVNDGPFSGAITKGTTSSVKQSTEIRIDYIQHALSAFLRYRALNQAGK